MYLKGDGRRKTDFAQALLESTAGGILHPRPVEATVQMSRGEDSWSSDYHRPGL
jgi:hypothetical protein